MKIKYSFSQAGMGYGHRFWILSDWGEWKSTEKNDVIQKLMNPESIWKGCDKVYPWDAEGIKYVSFIKAWEFEEKEWNEEKLVSLMNSKGFTMEKMESDDWDTSCMLRKEEEVYLMPENKFNRMNPDFWD